MSDWKTKSKQNIKSAELLIKNSNYSSSVHCSYYSNIQLMLHILLNDFGKTEDEIAKESKKGSMGKKGYHNWLKNTITQELMKKNFMIVRDFNNFFGELKSLRVSADYKNMLIVEKKAKKGLDLSNYITIILEEKFTV